MPMFVGTRRAMLFAQLGIASWIIYGAAGDYDFVNGRYHGPPITTSRATEKMVVAEDGVYRSVPANTLAREFIPRSLRTNHLRNNTMQGASPGVPGVLPTTWYGSSSFSGLNREIVGTGIDNNIEYIDIRISGTSTASITNFAFIGLVGNQDIKAITGQTWVGSAYTKIVGGSSANLTNLTMQIVEADSAGATIVSPSVLLNLSGATLSESRSSNVRYITSASTAYAFPRISMSAPSGAAIDFTLRIGLPQMEQASAASDPIRTAGFPVSVGGPRTNSLRNSVGGGAVLAQSQNALRNNTMQGASPGVPGILPNFWASTGSLSGLSRQILGTGIENGIDYIDLRFWGTAIGPNAFGIALESPGAIAAASGQAWTLSAYARLISGTLGDVSLVLRNREADSAGNPTGEAAVPVAPTYASLETQRLQAPRTFSGANSAQASPDLSFTVPDGAEVEFTIRLGAPQIEQASSAGTLTKTAGTAAAANPGSLPTNWLRGGAGTMEVVGSGVEDGIDYVDLAITSTTSATFILQPEANAQVPAALSQVWAGSFYATKRSGPAVTAASAVLVQRASNASGLSNFVNAITLGSGSLLSQRYSRVAAMDSASAAFVSLQFTVTVSAGRTVIRFGLPQLERNAAVTETIKTTGSAVTVDQERQNLIRNNTGVGAVAGRSQNAIRNSAMQGASVGTPGVIPTNWTITSGLDRQVIGLGVEDGIDYIDLRYSGVASNNNIRIAFEGISSTSAAEGQVWTASVYAKLVGGSLPGANNEIRVNAANEINGTYFSLDTGSLSAKRFSFTRTLNAGTTGVAPLLRIALVTGQAYDFTIRIGLPQLEQSPVPGPVTRTTGTAVAFSAGTFPTNWSGGAGGAGANHQIIGTGKEGDIEYIDIRFFGTTTASGFFSVYYDSSTPGFATNTFTHSVYMRVVSGTSMNWSVQFQERDASNGVIVSGVGSTAVMTSSLQRYSATRTLTNSATVATRSILAASFSSGVTLDLTIRFGLPQLERGSIATDPIRTAGSVGTVGAGSVGCRGALVETSQTNVVRNNAMQGVQLGSPGVIPNFWGSVTPAGLTRQIVAAGVEAGIDYFDLRFSGTTTSAASGISICVFDSTTLSPAAVGQLWTSSAFVKLMGGSTVGLQSLNIDLTEFNSSGGGLSAGSVGINPMPAGTNLAQCRFSASKTLSNASVAYAMGRITVTIPNATAVDFTLRIGWPQVEQWPSTVTTTGAPSSPIRTTTSGLARAADVLTADGFNLTDFTLIFQGVSTGFNGSLAGYLNLNAGGSSQNQGSLRNNTAGSAVIGISNRNGSQATTFPQFTLPAPNTPLGIAYAQDGLGNASLSVNGQAPVAAVSNQPPAVPLTRLHLGHSFGDRQLNGYIRRGTVLPIAANNSVQALSNAA